MAPYLRGFATRTPPASVELRAIVERERDRYERQLGGLSPAVRARVEAGLGIESVPEHEGLPSELALWAAEQALARAAVTADELGAIIDYSTVPGDHPAVAALANQLQGELGAERAVPFAAHGSGCAGLLVALRVAEAWLRSNGGAVLLFGADCVPAGGRCSLPISIMGDAASAAVLSARPPPSGPRVALRAVSTTTLGAHHALVRATGCPPRIEVDAQRFERYILPVHFVMCQRVLTRALAEAAIPRESISRLVYPNTTALDRASVARALGFAPEALSGPGPRHLGHAFASDLLLNLPDLTTLEPPTAVAMLAVGSGFTWGAAILDVEPAP